jgi:hypothetical protein
MSKEMLVMALGLWIIIVPYLGIPGGWKSTIFLISGIIIVLVGFFLRTEALSRQNGNRASRHQPFVENVATSHTDQHGNERKEGINSLN